MKKKLLLLILVSINVQVVCAQHRIKLPINQTAITKQRDWISMEKGKEKLKFAESPYEPVTGNLSGDLIAGYTAFDLQTNASLGNRIWYYDDGTASIVWTYGAEGTEPDFPERGTGYNYYDGEAWSTIPTEAIEDDRCGWPGIAAWGGNGEIVVSHLSGQTIYTDGGLLINRRENKGTGDWIQTYLQGPPGMGGTDIHWPRIMTSGENHQYIHIITPAASPTNGQDVPLLYTRSQDGENWTEWTIFDELSSAYYNGFSADEYTWAESRGDVCAFTISSPWHDWIVMKSNDNGESWEKMIIWEHPYPFFDWNNTITIDTIWAPDNSADIAIDNNGTVHAVCGLTRVMHEEAGTNFTYFPYTDGIIYWNETMPPFTAENQHKALSYDNLVENQTLIGWMQDINGDGEITLLDEIQTYRELGLSTMPNISINKTSNQILVVWASTTEYFDNGIVNFKHIWARATTYGTQNWSQFIDMNDDIIHWSEECIYPCLAGDFTPGNFICDWEIPVLYQADLTPGIACFGQHVYHQNKIYAFKEFYIPPGIKENKTENTVVFQNTPNPFTSKSTVFVETKESTHLSLEVSTVTGQIIQETDKGVVKPGRHSFTISAYGLHPGIYFYSVISNNNRITKKMIIK